MPLRAPMINYKELMS